MSRSRAVGGVHIGGDGDDGRVGWVAVAGKGASGQGKNGGNGELHLVGSKAVDLLD